MKKKLELQTLIVLLCVLAIAGAWIGIQITKDSLGVWSEASELHFTTPNLLGLGPRSELRCSGAVIGHVRKVTPSIGPDGEALFTLVGGVKKDFADWKFAPLGLVKAGVVQSALAPSSITLDLSTDSDAVQARNPRQGPPPNLLLAKEKSENDFTDVAVQYRKLGDEIDRTIRQFTEPQDGRTKSVLEEFAEALPAAASSLRQLETMTAKLERDLSEKGKLDQTITSLNSNLARLQILTDEVTQTVGGVQGRMDTSLKKVNGLLDETTGTMVELRSKMEGFGGTFMGRMLVGKPSAAATPSPTPKKTR
ncbi:MAG: hypothetical protein ACOYMS_02000 [Terrimicrobiaceae bacterium]